MGKVGGRPMGSFSQGGGREVVGVGTAGSRRWRHVRWSYVRGFWVRERGGLDCVVGGLKMGEVVGCLVRSFGQGEVGARWWLGSKRWERW